MSHEPLTHAGLLAEAAAHYLSLGLSVIALTGKTPNVTVHRHGLHDHITGAPESFDDYNLIYKAFAHPDTTGIGILTDHPYVVVDIDGPVGAEEWQAITGSQYMADPRWVAMTRHGLHLWFATEKRTGTIKLGTKLDLKGEGGYVAAPPSRFDDDPACERWHQPTTEYQWLLPPSEEPPFEVPDALGKLIAYHAAQRERRLGGKAQRKAVPVIVKIAGQTFTSTPSFEGVYEAMKKAEEGNRNHMLYWAAATIVEEGGTSEDLEELERIALSIGLDREETRRTIRSGGRVG